MSGPNSPLVAAVTRRAKLLVVLCALGGLTPVLASLVPAEPASLGWVIDLAAHWQWVYAVLGGVCVTWLVALGSYAWAALPAALLTIGFSWASPAPYPATPYQLQALTVVTANLNADNPDTSALRNWVEELSADIVVLEEVTPALQPQLERWAAYPYRVIHAQEGPFGIAILSRHPLEEPQALEDAGQTLHVRTHVRWRDTQLALAAVHPMPPVSAEYHALRESLFDSESRWVASTERPAIIAGDFNATPWSRAMRSFVAHGLRPATTLQPTWPALLPMIPIDQVVVSPHWQVINAGVGPRIGSDHRPAYAVLAPVAR